MPEKQDTQWVFKTFKKVTAIHTVLHVSELTRTGLLHQSFSVSWSQGKNYGYCCSKKKKTHFSMKEWTQKLFHGVSVSCLSANI